jgi:ribosome-associated protein
MPILALLRQSILTSATHEFSRSSGPGGQNVNKVNSKVTLRIKLDLLEGLSDAEKAHLSVTLSGRITQGKEIVISSSEERSQRINLLRAYERMENLIASAARLPRLRRPTKPSRASAAERLRTKKILSLKKQERREGIKPEN